MTLYDENRARFDEGRSARVYSVSRGRPLFHRRSLLGEHVSVWDTCSDPATCRRYPECAQWLLSASKKKGT